jgi:hypothetical protein
MCGNKKPFYPRANKEKSPSGDLLELGSRDLNPKFHVQSVTCCRYTTPQGDGYFTTLFSSGASGVVFHVEQEQ